ncbi:hypothetical protein [Domibacillus indicus]|uniref:hypothetical protein n=1 Tax=Domibacillus indicus TaxID=1437523 RepID=UPI00061833B4|nr:hypothetical protein [Domibacillus indicus]
MSDSQKNPKVLSDKIIDLLVSNTFQKNGVNVEKAKQKLSDEQKQMLKDLVTDLTSQVNSFVKEQPSQQKKPK